VALVVKNPPANAGDARDSGLVPGSERSPGEGNGNPFVSLRTFSSWDTDHGKPLSHMEKSNNNKTHIDFEEFLHVEGRAF